MEQTPAKINDDIKHLDQLTQRGQHLDALRFAQNAWGTIEDWVHEEQIIVAIKLMYHLGGDRASDALLLRSYRQRPHSGKLVERMLYYYLNRFGIIISLEFFDKHEHLLSSTEGMASNVLAFKSITRRELKDFSAAEQYIQQAIQLAPDDHWLSSVQCRLLSEQELDLDALEMAKANYAHIPSVNNLRTYLQMLQKIEGLRASFLYLKSEIEQFQSCILWQQLASMAASELEWETCEYAMTQFDSLRVFDDKNDVQRNISFLGQIQLYKNQFSDALQTLKQHKGGYWKLVCENLQSPIDNPKIKVLEVPFYRQEHLTCAPTTMASIANYWGRKVDSKDIADDICFDGTPDTLERQWLRDNGYQFVEFNLETSYVYRLIDAGIPFCLVTTSGFTSHLQAVIGYNQHIGSMYVMDPSYSGMQEMLIKQTIEYEAYHGCRCLAFVPNEEASKLAEFSPPDAALYELWDQFSLAKQNNDASRASHIVAKMQSVNRAHQLSYKSARDYAIWNNDYAQVQRFNETLLTTYPKETTLLNSQYYCLRDTGRRSEALSHLEHYLDMHLDINLSKTLFDEIYDTSEKPALISRLLTQLKRYGSYREGVHESLANYYWSNQEREKAIEHYRIAYCLDDTNNANVETYFKASRYLNQESTALSFLHDRFEKYASRSPMPAISLLKAYELLNEEHKGIAYLERAVALHPNDKSLLKTFSKELIRFGLFEALAQIQQQLTATLSAEDNAQLQAELLIKKGHIEQALPYYKGMFESRPLQCSTAETYFGLLYKLHQTETLDKTVDSLLDKYPDNGYVYDYVIDWHSDEKRQRWVLEKAVKNRPDSGFLRRKLIDKLLRLGAKEEALLTAKETVELIKGEHNNLAFLAKAHIACGDFEEGKAKAKEALSVDVDNDLAFELLMTASRQPQDKIDSLGFVLAQIKAQTIFGDSAWNYWFEAKTLLPEASLREFIEYLQSHLSHLWYCDAISGFYYKQLGDTATAIAHFESGIEKFPFTPRLYKELGHLLEIEGRSNLAADAYRKALEINPGWSEVAKQLVDLYEKDGNFDAAIAVLLDTIKHTVDDGSLYGYLADLHLRKNDDEQALIALTKAVEYLSDYDWAWYHIKQIGERQDKPNLAYDLAKSISEKQPYLPQVWINCASLAKNQDEKHALIRKAIAVDPFNQNAYIALVDYYQRAGDYQSALDVLKNTPWKAHLPFSLITLQADLFSQIGQLDDAVEALSSVLFTTSGNSKHWQNLYAWLIRLDKSAAIVAAANKQVSLNLHDANSLCYAAEMLARFGNDEDKLEAQAQLRKAYELAPNDQYIVLTYADSLMQENEFALALDMLKQFEKFAQSDFARAREIMCLIKLDKSEQALASYAQLLSQEEGDYWTLQKPFERFIESLGFDKSIAVYEQRLAELNEVQAYIWADAVLANKGISAYKNIVKLLNQHQAPLLTDGAVRAIFEAWNDDESKGDAKVIAQYADVCGKNSPVFEQFCMLMFRVAKYGTIVETYSKFENKNTLSMFSFYQVRSAMQLIGQWDEAGELIERGLKQAPDSSIHNMRLWYFYELWRNGSTFDSEELDVIDYHELIEVERYVFSTLKAAMSIGDRDIESCLEDITPALRRCQEDNQAAHGHPLASAAQKLLKERLVARISSTGFFAKMLVKWKLMNRF